MTAKPLRFRRAARLDVEGAIDYLDAEAGLAAAQAFIDDLQNTYERVQDWPAGGSSRFAVELAIPDLRHRRLSRHPYLVFYAERADLIEVWRVLHGARDIAQAMRSAS